jgi:uncharacterized protein YwqG
MEWPSWGGALLSFLGQIDLGSLPSNSRVDWMPREGLLLFFYDWLSVWGTNPGDRVGWCVLHLDPAASTIERQTPSALTEMGQFRRKNLRLQPALSLPSYQRVGFDFFAVEGEARDEYLEARDRDAWAGGPRHQFLGWPDPVQNDTMEEECQLAFNGYNFRGDPRAQSDPRIAELLAGAGEWELLLQLDTDNEIGMEWGDNGMLYFWVRRDDARRGDFSNVWMILQCY